MSSPNLWGANPATVSAWENRAGISVEDAWGVADYYGVSIDELVGRKAPERKPAA